jgi:hypothetical protein
MPHGREPGMYCNSFEAKQVVHTDIWNIRVGYTNNPDLSNPLSEPAKINMKSQRQSGATLVDNKGRMMLNTAGVPFEPQEKGETLIIISVQKNVADYPAWLLDYPDAINNDSVRIRKLTCQPHTLALTSISIPDYIEQDKKARYLTLEFELTYRKSGWKTKVPSRGFSEKVWQTDRNGTRTVWNGELQPIIGPNGPISEPMLLDKDGVGIRKPKPEDVVLLDFTIPDERPFNALPFK